MFATVRAGLKPEDWYDGSIGTWGRGKNDRESAGEGKTLVRIRIGATPQR